MASISNSDLSSWQKQKLQKELLSIANQRAVKLSLCFPCLKQKFSGSKITYPKTDCEREVLEDIMVRTCAARLRIEKEKREQVKVQFQEILQIKIEDSKYVVEGSSQFIKPEHILNRILVLNKKIKLLERWCRHSMTLLTDAF